MESQRSQRPGEARTLPGRGYAASEIAREMTIGGSAADHGSEAFRMLSRTLALCRPAAAPIRNGLTRPHLPCRSQDVLATPYRIASRLSGRGPSFHQHDNLSRLGAKR